MPVTAGARQGRAARPRHLGRAAGRDLSVAGRRPPAAARRRDTL